MLKKLLRKILDSPTLFSNHKEILRVFKHDGQWWTHLCNDCGVPPIKGTVPKQMGRPDDITLNK
mgnify:FL=1